MLQKGGRRGKWEGRGGMHIVDQSRMRGYMSVRIIQRDEGYVVMVFTRFRG